MEADIKVEQGTLTLHLPPGSRVTMTSVPAWETWLCDRLGKRLSARIITAIRRRFPRRKKWTIVV